jgi:CcmD family protein
MTLHEGSTMAAFATAYGIVWLAVMLYVVRLGARQRRLLRSYQLLQCRLKEGQNTHEADADAA